MNTRSCAILMILAVAVLFISGSSATVSAATPTPTLKPIVPTPTSAYIYLRPTPTMIPINNDPDAFPIVADPGPVADWAINTYRFVNRDHIVDFLMTGLVVMIGVTYLIRIISRQTKTGE